jgi:transcriptional regulator with XRE-family HTH domain
MFAKQLSVQMLKVIDQRNLTLEKVSELTGMSRKFVSNVVNGKQVPTIDSFEKICTALELEPNDLLLSEKSKAFGRTEPMRINKVFCETKNHIRSVTPICPSCNSLLSGELQGYCDCCGQRLSWHRYSEADITFEKPRKHR